MNPSSGMGRCEVVVNNIILYGYKYIVYIIYTFIKILRLVKFAQL